jgi:methionyl-tRNA synthetase
MKTIYITTSIVYPNARPHIGYALELAQADFFARYYRLAGHPVYFLTGQDEHGIKIQQAAEKAGKTPKAFVDEMAEVVHGLVGELQLTNDRFIRTTDSDHEAMAQALWSRCLAKGDIYKKRYQAWYNIKEEEFMGLVEQNPDPSVFGIDPRFIEQIDEENYFFALSKYKDQIKEALSTGLYRIIPESRKLEILNFIDEHGVEDVSISREKTKLAWGVPVPGDESQVMYVWFDALTNYLSAVGTVDGQGKLSTNEFWPATLHCIGKDISRFHSLIWTGMLLSADIALPEELLVHGFLTANGQKMSKSTGNVVDPFEVIGQYGSDVVRWYLLKEVPTTDDADFSNDRLQSVFLADLANDFGNLVSRTWTMCQKYSDGKVPAISGEGEKVITAMWKAYHELILHDRQIHSALHEVHQVMVYCNKLIDERKPWVLAKDPEKKAELDSLLYGLLEIVRHISLVLSPVLPTTTSTIASRVFPEMAPEKWKFEEGSQWGQLSPGQSLGAEQTILFPKSV